MAYNSKTQFASLGTIDLDAATADLFTWDPLVGMVIHQVTLRYSEATPGSLTQAGVVSVDVTPSGGARTEYGTYTAEVSKAIGDSVRCLNASTRADLAGTVDTTTFDPIELDPGDTLIIEHKTQQTSMEAGQVEVIIYYELIPNELAA